MSDKTQTELATELAQTIDKVKEYAEDFKGKMEKGEKLSETAKQTADEALTAVNELKERLLDVEQKSATRPTGGEENDYRTYGERFVSGEAYKSLQADPRGVKTAKLDIKANITSATTDTAGSAGSLVEAQRLGGIIAPPNRRLTIRDLIMAGTTDSNALTYIRETGFTNAAAVQQNEGDKAQQSDIKFDEVSTNVVTLTHFFKASRQILDDASQLQSYINGRLTYGLKLVEEQQILNGDGQAGRLKGIIPQATAFSDKASLAKYTILDQLRLAVLQAILAEYPASGHVLNPIDWAKIETAKDDNGRYIIGNPQGVTTPTMWGVPVIATQAMGVGKFLTGAFDLGAQIFDRQQSSIQVGFENDDFTRHLITILAEERLALAVYRPEAFIHGTLADKV